MSTADSELVRRLHAIVEKGNSAEVKKNKDGDWVVYEVKKKKVG